MIKIPENAEKIIDTLALNGYEAYIVGGCVRDLLLGLAPNDFDITTNALPTQIKAVFPKTVDTGIKHGTVTVIDESGTPFEVTTYRTESGYTDMRHPKDVKFVSDIKEDLSRRDFTVNALAFNETKGLIDYFGGQNDIKNKVLSAVGNPKIRFTEDALRILRLFRFSSTLGFRPTLKTKHFALKLCKNLKNISAERVSAELIKTLLGKKTDAVRPLIKRGGLSFFGINNCKKLKSIEKLKNEENLRLFAFLKLCECEPTSVIKNLKLKNSFKGYFEKANSILFLNEKSSDSEIKLALAFVGADIVYDVISYKTHILGENLNETAEKTKRIIKSCEPYSIHHLKINGEDIKKLGFRDKEIGEVLENLANEVRKNPQKNEKETLLNLIKK